VSTSWAQSNDSYVALSLSRLRLLLGRAAQRRAEPGAPPAPEPPAPAERRRSLWRARPDALPALPAAPADRRGGDLDDTIAEVQTQLATLVDGMAAPPALAALADAFGLSDFERDTLLLCAAPELDTGIGELLDRGYGQRRPSFAIAMDLLDNACWDVRSPQRPLRYWQLVGTGDEVVSNTAALAVDERTLHAIKGLHHLDARVAHLVEMVPGPGNRLPASQQIVADDAVDLLHRAAAAGELPLLQLIGPHAADRTAVAAAITGALRLDLYCVRTSTLAGLGPADLVRLARLWQRETLLGPVALLLEEDTEDNAPAACGARNTFVRHTGGLLLGAGIDLLTGLPVPTVSLDVARPNASEQTDSWAAALGSVTRADVAALAEQFRLDNCEIRRIVATTALPDEPHAATRALQAAARRSLRPRLAKLATWVRPVATWDTLVLPQTELRQLHDITDQVAHRSKVYSQWGFGARMNRGLGVNALFAGESGTGKTMAAEVLANALGLDLYRIDLAGVVDKYVGETPKHVRTIFDWGDAGEAILFFDECDAIFGKRSEVKDAHDRYANIEIDYLLQRMETYRGVAILATNMRDAVDPAFLRRLRFVVNFPFPSAADRERMWRDAFPADAPVGCLDHARLARIPLTGAGIADAAMGAAFRAAADDHPVEMADVLDAARAVLRKHNRPINEADFRCDPQALPV
jgi:hypothetical protein